MLLPRSHIWTLRQKWLIVSIVVTLLALAGVGVFTYERYFRGPGDEVIFGTWLNPISVDPEATYYEFLPSHSFHLWRSIDTKTVPIFSGRWYAGGRNIYLRIDEPDRSWPMILHILDISPNEMRVRLSRESRDQILCFKRVDHDLPPRI
jgi:hypothetical protein